MKNKLAAVVSAMVFSAGLSTVALAAPSALTDTQMDQITAGEGEPAAFAQVTAFANNGAAAGTFALVQGEEFSSAAITGRFVNNQPNPNNFFSLSASVQNQ